VIRDPIISQDRGFADAHATWVDAEGDIAVVAASHDRVPSLRAVEESRPSPCMSGFL
jgi:hypothetical protein